MIQRSLKEAPEEEVLYYSCELDKDPDVIREIVQAARRLRPQAKRWRIFLDEVTSIPNWQVGMKWLRDNTPAANDTFVVTGSSSIDLAAGAERMPGRRGSVERPDRILLPLSFADYARLHGLTPPAVLRLPEFLEPRAREVLTQATCASPSSGRSWTVTFTSVAFRMLSSPKRRQEPCRTWSCGISGCSSKVN